MFFKKIAAFSAAMTILLSSYAYGSSLYTVHDLSQETRLSSGITYERIERYTSAGWMNINVIRADLTDAYTEIEPITNGNGVSNRSPLSGMMKSSGATAAVNGDFFAMTDPTNTYGPLIENGKIITSPLPYQDGYPTVSRLNDQTIDISVWNPKITLFGSDSTTYNAVIINKSSYLDWGPTVLTKDWNNTSPGYDGKKDIVEVVVIGNTVSEVRKNQPSTVIPEDGYVFASRDQTTMANMLNSFTPGQPASLNIELDFSPDQVEWAFGALNHIVKDGQVNDISDQVLGAHPRTAIGYNKDNTEMIMVTIDGRHKDYVGVKQSELCDIMMGLGAYNAVNMDGGGSTTMGVDFLRNSNITIVNIPSEGKERKIASGVGVFNTSPQSNTVANLEIIPEQESVFNNTEVGLKLNFYNEYETPIEANAQDFEFTVSPKGAGEVISNVFYPTKAGNVTITAEIDDAQGEVTLNVLDTPVALKLDTNSVTLGFGEKFQIGKILGNDADGNSAYIPEKYVAYSYRNRIGKVENGIFTAGDTSNTGAITLSVGDAIKHIQVKVGYRFKTLQRFDDLSNLKLTLYPEGSAGNISLEENIVKEGNKSLKLDYDFTKMTDQSISFVEFGKDGEGIKLEDKPLAIGMWVYGDGKNHWLRTRITDAYDNQIKITFADEVNWTGWKWVEAHIPEGTSYPVTLKNIYLAEINETKKDTGTIYIDNLRILYEPKDKQLGLTEETQFADPLKENSVDTLEKLVVKNGNKELSGNEIIYVDGVISNGSLSATNTTMWNNIKSLVNYEDKALVLNLNSTLDNIYDEREVKILKEILEEAAEKNTVFVVCNGKEGVMMENGVRYVSYDDSFELGITNDGLKYKN